MQEEPDNKDAVLTTDVEGAVNYVSPGAEKRLRRKSNHLIGRPLAAVIAEAYEMTEEQAQPLVTNVIQNGYEETLLSETKSSGKRIADILTPLRDAQGENFGAALKFSAPLVKTQQSGHALALQTAIDALPVGMLLVNEDLQVLHLNSYAQEIINHNKVLEYSQDKLSARERSVQQSLTQLVESSVEQARSGIQQGSDAIFIKSSPQADQIEVIATPSLGDDGEVIIVLYLFDASLERVVSRDILTRLYGLTKTEAKLAQLLVGGATLDSAAQSLEISVNTARTHLKHVFHKTGINRQAELVHRIETGPAALLVDFNDTH